VAPSRSLQPALIGVAALLFAASAAITIIWCSSMSAMAGMPMPGGWTMSMTWMRMPGQSWPGAAAMFLGMWLVMMLAMMLPSLLPMLWRYRHGVAALAGAGYFLVWSVVGVIVFLFGVALAAIVMQQPVLARTVPIAAGIVVLAAGILQFTHWKLRHLSCCRATPVQSRTQPGDDAGAFRYGVRLGLHCVQCCGGLIAILLVIGVMNLAAMTVVAVAISVERLLPAGPRVARIMGAVVVATGVLLIARATAFG